MLETAETAAETLKGLGHSVSIWDVQVVSPLDQQMIRTLMNIQL